MTDSGAELSRQAEPGVEVTGELDDFEPEPSQPPRRLKWIRMTLMALGVPLVLAALMVVLYLAGVIRDVKRADYCAVYAETSAPLVPLYGDLADVLAEGDPDAVLAKVMAIREHIDRLDDQPSTPEIDSRLSQMTRWLQEAERAARSRQAEEIAQVNDQLGVFNFYRQSFITLSSEYCRYR